MRSSTVWATRSVLSGASSSSTTTAVAEMLFFRLSAEPGVPGSTQTNVRLLTGTAPCSASGLRLAATVLGSTTLSSDVDGWRVPREGETPAPVLSCNELAVDDRRGGGGGTVTFEEPALASGRNPSDVDAEDGAGAGARAAVPIGDAAWPMLSDAPWLLPNPSTLLVCALLSCFCTLSETSDSRAGWSAS